VAGISSFGSNPGVAIGPLTTNAEKLLRQVASTTTENNKIEKSAKDFESILLGSWLQQAEQSFGSLPGGDGEEDADSGKDQFQGIAMQALGASMTGFGGIGIAKMIAKNLHKAEDARVDQATKTSPAPTK
jgi:Rod binding domain-containing protein